MFDREISEVLTVSTKMGDAIGINKPSASVGTSASAFSQS
jgi:hypothetical protein